MGLPLSALCVLLVHIFGPHNLRAVQVLPCLDPAEPALNLKGTVVSGDPGDGGPALRLRLTGYPATSAWASSARENPFHFSVALWVGGLFVWLFCVPLTRMLPRYRCGAFSPRSEVGRLKGGRYALDGGIPCSLFRYFLRAEKLETFWPYIGAAGDTRGRW